MLRIIRKQQQRPRPRVLFQHCPLPQPALKQPGPRLYLKWYRHLIHHILNLARLLVAALLLPPQLKQVTITRFWHLHLVL